MLTDRDIVIIASIDWEPLWQSHQEVASRFAAAGNRVLFVENTGIRGPRAGELARVWRRLLSWWKSRSAGTTTEPPPLVRPNVRVFTPLVLPPFGPAAVRALNRRLFLRPVPRAARAMGIRDPIVWTWLPTDTARDLAEMLLGERGVLVYVSIGDLESLASKPMQLRQAERELMQRSDIVLAHTESNWARCRETTEDVFLFPPSVNLDLFVRAAVPSVVSPRPTVGYVGGLHAIVDVELIARSALLRSDLDWKLAGPVQCDVSALRGLANVELIGPVEHKDIPQLIAGFDVCTVPYRTETAVREVAPTKINEYLAVGRPVVATDLPWVLEFQRRHPVLEVVPAEADAFIEGIDRALAASTDVAAADARRAAAETSDWTARLEWVSDMVEQRLTDS
jgi:glycosyltransferase involved in cell wall biosynthesis